MHEKDTECTLVRQDNQQGVWVSEQRFNVPLDTLYTLYTLYVGHFGDEITYLISDTQETQV